MKKLRQPIVFFLLGVCAVVCLGATLQVLKSAYRFDSTITFAGATGWTTNAAYGAIPVGKLTISNLTGNITIPGFSGTDSTNGYGATFLAIPDSSTRTVTLPPNCFSTDGQRTYYVTNGTARVFHFTIYADRITNCASVPCF